MNKVILIGRLCRDAEVRYTTDQMAIARDTLAVDRPKKKDSVDSTADFISIVAFGKTAEFFEKFGLKGRKFAIEGRIQTGSYTKEDGTTVRTSDVVVERVEFCESKASGSNTSNPQPASADGFMNIPDGIDEELPFN